MTTDKQYLQEAFERAYQRVQGQPTHNPKPKTCAELMARLQATIDKQKRECRG